MKLKSIHLLAFPGVARPYRIDEFASGITVLWGPNASGKTTLVRAFRALVFPSGSPFRPAAGSSAARSGGRPTFRATDRDRPPSGDQGAGPIALAAEFEMNDGRVLAVERHGNEIVWTSEGARCAPPLLPHPRYASCFTIEVDDLLAPGQTETHLVDHLTRNLMGGYDFVALARRLRLSEKPKVASLRVTELDNAERAVDDLLTQRVALIADEAKLAAIRAEGEAAKVCAGRRPLLDGALNLIAASDSQERAAAILKNFPPNMALLRGNEDQKLQVLVERLDDARARQRTIQASLREDETAQARLRESRQRMDDVRLQRATGCFERLMEAHHGLVRDIRRINIANAALLETESSLRGSGNTSSASGTTLRRDGQSRALISPDQVGQAEIAISEKRNHAARVAALDAEQARLAAGVGLEVDASQIAVSGLRLDRALSNLRTRLAALLRASNALEGWLALDAHRSASLALRDRVGGWVGGAELGLLIAALGFGLNGLDLVGPSDVGAPGVSQIIGVVLLAMLGLLVASRRWRARLALSAAIAERERAFSLACPEQGIEWSRQAVLAALGAVHSERAAQAQRDGDLRRLATLSRERVGLVFELAQAERTLRRLASEVGFGAEQLDASFERWLRLTRDRDRAAIAAAEARAELNTRYDLVLSIATELAGLVGLEAPERDLTFACPAETIAGIATWAEQVKATLAHQTDVSKRWELVTTRLAEGYRRARREAEAIEQATAMVAGFWREVGFEGLAKTHDDRSARRLLEERLAQRPAWTEARDALLAAEGARQLATAQWTQAADDNDDAALRRELEDRIAARELDRIGADRDAAIAAQHHVTALARRESEILVRVDQARAGRLLEEARANRDAAAEALGAARDRVLLDQASVFLMNDVEAEYSTQVKPAVVSEAQSLFGAFTDHHFSLQVQSVPNAGSPGVPALAFSARDETLGRTRALFELSVGTRTQLLLAVRLAYARSIERDVSSANGAGGEGSEARLPIFVDEALATADDRRCRTVAESLARLSESQGRQVIYLTAHGHEVGLWRDVTTAVKTVDLVNAIGVGDGSSLRSSSVANWPALAAAAPPVTKAPLEPGGLSTRGYAQALQLPMIDPWAPVTTYHLLHLFPDDLAQVERCLMHWLSTVGQLESTLEHAPSHPALAGRGDCVKLRIEAAEAYQRLWRRGRVRPLRLVDLQAASLGKFSRHISELLGELRRQPDQIGPRTLGDSSPTRRLLEALGAGRIKGFGPKRVEDFHRWLSAGGYLYSSREPLDATARWLLFSDGQLRASGGKAGSVQRSHRMSLKVSQAMYAWFERIYGVTVEGGGSERVLPGTDSAGLEGRDPTMASRKSTESR